MVGIYHDYQIPVCYSTEYNVFQLEKYGNLNWYNTCTRYMYVALDLY